LEKEWLRNQTEGYYDEGLIKHLLKLFSLPGETFTIFFVKMLIKGKMEK